jgi:hypothetical protein
MDWTTRKEFLEHEMTDSSEDYAVHDRGGKKEVYKVLLSENDEGREEKPGEARHFHWEDLKADLHRIHASVDNIVKQGKGRQMYA